MPPNDDKDYGVGGILRNRISDVDSEKPKKPVGTEEPGESEESKDLAKATDDDSIQDQADDTQANEESDEIDELADSGYYVPSPQEASISGRLSKRKKKGLAIGVGGGLVALIAFVMLISPTFALVHIKNMFYKNIGGVQSNSYQMGRKMYYKRMLFFDQDGKFDGYKKTGIRGIMYQNRQSKGLANTLRQNGYSPNFNNKGRLVSLDRIDRQGNIIPGQSIGDPSKLGTAWDIRSGGDLEKILATIYPDETARWHGKQAKKLYQRWGLTRTNWISDYLKKATGVTFLENKELVLRAALREHLTKRGTIGKIGAGVSSKDKATAADKNLKDNDPAKQAAQAVVASDSLADEISEAASKERTLMSDPNYVPQRATLDAIEAGIKGGASPSTVVRNVGGSISAINTIQIACVGRSSVHSIVAGARILRSAQLMAFGMSVLNIADAVQNGESVSSTDVAILMAYLSSVDSNGNNMWGSAGMRYWSSKANGQSFAMNKIDKEQVNRYSVGGGLTGTLASLMSTFDTFTKSDKVCKKANSFIGNALGLLAGVGLTVFTGGTFTATNIAASVGLGIMVGVARGIAIDMLTPMVAGTLINGSEKGSSIGNALSSGLRVLSTANASNYGGMPLTKPQALAAESELRASNQMKIAQMSLKDRLFSPENTQSLATMAFLNASSFRPINLLSSPATLFSKSLNPLNIFGSKALAASNDELCNDLDIVKYNLAASIDCSLEIGIPSSMIEDPEYYPDNVDAKMIAGGYINADGNPVTNKDGGMTANSKKYQNYLKQCTSDTPIGGNDYRSIDVIHKINSNGQEFTKECYSNPLFNMYRFYSYIGQTESEGLLGVGA